MSGTTGNESAHTHAGGTLSYKSTGKFYYHINEDVADTGPATSGCFSKTKISLNTDTGYGYQGDGDSDNWYITIDTSSGTWSGKSAAGTSHNHSFSSSATIGSGSYTRPNSRSTIYIIKY